MTFPGRLARANAVRPGCMGAMEEAEVAVAGVGVGRAAARA